MRPRKSGDVIGIDNPLLGKRFMTAAAAITRLTCFRAFGSGAVVLRRRRTGPVIMGPVIMQFVIMGSASAAGNAESVSMRHPLRRMMVDGWQQPASDQVGDERQMGDKTLHEVGACRRTRTGNDRWNAPR